MRRIATPSRYSIEPGSEIMLCVIREQQQADMLPNRAARLTVNSFPVNMGLRLACWSLKIFQFQAPAYLNRSAPN